MHQSKTFRFGLFISASIIASALNYLTYPFLARLLGDVEFVEVTVALSLLTQISAFLSSLVALTVGLTKDGHKKETPGVDVLQSVLFKIFMVVVLIFCLTAPFTMNGLEIPLLYTLPIAAMLLFSVPTSIVSGYYSGLGNLVKLGSVALLTALSQFILCITVALATRNGVLALAAMGVGQIISLLFIYTVFRKDKLPKLTVNEKVASNIRLIRYAFVSSIAVMTVNLLQIADLLIAKSYDIQVVLYTDIYVISRVVFFAGMILIWPFLSWIDTRSHKKNAGIMLRVAAIITIGCAAAIIGMVSFGDLVTQLLTGAVYTNDTLIIISTLSILYKMVYLLIIMFVLYFIVMRSYWAAIIPLSTTTLLIFYVLVLSGDTTLRSMLTAISMIGLFGLTLSILAFILGYHNRLLLTARLQ